MSDELTTGSDVFKRCVIIQKDERGYGLRVSGESPVFVESVKEGGAAWRAGVRPGDEIIKVSGTLVTRMNHGEVVRMIQSCGSYVGLTLLSLKNPPPSTTNNMQAKPIQITGPQPASESTQQAYDDRKMDIFRDMINKQREYLEEMIAKRNQTEIDKTLKTIKHLEKEIEKMTLDAQRHRHTSMSAENLTTGSTSDPTIVSAANGNAKKSHSFGQYDTRAPIMTMESDEDNDDYTNNNNKNNSFNVVINNSNNRRNSNLLINQKSKYPDINEIPKTVDQLHGYSLQMTRFLLTQDLKPHALLFHTIAGHVFPLLVAQMGPYNQKAIQRLAWQIASTWLMHESPLTFADFPPELIDRFGLTLESSQQSLDTLFEPFFGVTRDILKEQLESWRHTINLGLAPPTMPTAKEELHAILDLVLNESTSIRELEVVVDSFIQHANVNNTSTMAVVTALLTIGHCVFACHTKHLLFTQANSSQPINPVLKLSMDQSNKKHKRAVSLQNRNQMPGHIEAGHHFNPTYEFTKPIFCYGCYSPVWGTYGLNCAHCQMSVHNWCMKSTSSTNPCPGPQSDNQSNSETTPSVRVPKKNRRWNSDRYTFLDMIKKIAPNNAYDIHAPPLISSSDDSSDDEDDDNTSGLTPQPLPSATSDTSASKSTTPTPPSTIGRSESFKQRRKTVPSYRKRSDPALPISNTNLANNSVAQDPNSSSPGVTGSPTSTSPGNWEDSSTDDDDDQSHSDVHSIQTPTTGSVTPQHTIDDDSQQPILDDDTPPPLPPRPPSEKRRQIRNEIIDSEGRHVKALDFIHQLYYKPIKSQNLMTKDQLSAVFSNTKKLYKIHKNILKALKAPQQSFEQSICDVFCGPLGQHLEEEASVFCTTQKLVGVDTWRSRKKDSKMKTIVDNDLRSKLLAESGSEFARLTLEDLLGSVFQRPLRYQLLLERLLQATPSDSIEYQLIARALTRSREIGAKVNEETRKAESRQRLIDIERKTERAPGFILDLADHSLVHEGPLAWRITKQKSVDILLVLTNRILVILTQKDNSKDKFVLKSHTNPANNTLHSPIVLLDDVITRDVATDQTAFFLISTDHHVFYEFSAANPNEKKQWRDLILSTASMFNANKPKVMKMKDLTTQQSTDEEFKQNDEEEEERDAEQHEDNVVNDDQNNNNNNTDNDISVETESQSKDQLDEQQKQSKIEGTIRYVREDECRPPELISPTQVTVSTEPNVAEALVIHSPEHRICEIDESIKQLLDEKRNILANLRGIKGEYEWTVVSDMGEHDHVSSSAREVTFFDRAMSLVSSLGTNGLTSDSYAPLVSLRDQIDALLARLTLSQIESDVRLTATDGAANYLASNESTEDTAVYF
ncbi:rho guanine nucleotide exchange factor 12-like [Oppia nitens]|uniref:rho guanine nucleotide exchange factor 12-like n=1 Tax=Oppia nitens TaxID=1686743 RepID=UPI0023DC9564|nr:rho guanine nucleotide exchange factor 12-like [Oppia nitens]